jgi:hypothetical protein
MNERTRLPYAAGWAGDARTAILSSRCPDFQQIRNLLLGRRIAPRNTPGILEILAPATQESE